MTIFLGIGKGLRAGARNFGQVLVLGLGLVKNENAVDAELRSAKPDPWHEHVTTKP